MANRLFHTDHSISIPRRIYSVKLCKLFKLSTQLFYSCRVYDNTARRGCYVITRARVFIFNCNRGLNNFCANIPTKFTDIRSFFFIPTMNLRHFFFFEACLFSIITPRRWQTTQRANTCRRSSVRAYICSRFVPITLLDHTPSIRQSSKWLINIAQSKITAIVGRGNLGNYSQLLSVPSRIRRTLMKPFIELHALQYASWNLEINACIAAYFNVRRGLKCEAIVCNYHNKDQAGDCLF